LNYGGDYGLSLSGVKREEDMNVRFVGSSGGENGTRTFEPVFPDMPWQLDVPADFEGKVEPALKMVFELNWMAGLQADHLAVPGTFFHSKLKKMFARNEAAIKFNTELMKSAPSIYADMTKSAIQSEKNRLAEMMPEFVRRIEKAYIGHKRGTLSAYFRKKEAAEQARLRRKEALKARRARVQAHLQEDKRCFRIIPTRS
jgi:hypothetical protein